MENQPVEPGKIYWVIVDDTRFKVRSVRPANLPGWWFCESIDAGDPLVVPERSLQAAQADE